MKFISLCVIIYTLYCISFFSSEIMYWVFTNAPDCVLEVVLKLHLLDWMS